MMNFHNINYLAINFAEANTMRNGTHHSGNNTNTTGFLANSTNSTRGGP